LRTLCADLSIDYDALPGGGKEDKVRELVAYFDRRVRIRDLRDKCAQERPNVKWPEYLISESSPPEVNGPVRREQEFLDKRLFDEGVEQRLERKPRPTLIGEIPAAGLGHPKRIGIAAIVVVAVAAIAWFALAPILLPRPTATPSPIVVVDTMDSLAGWTKFDDGRFITDTASIINFSLNQGMTDNAIQIDYDLRQGGFVGISKVITPSVISGTKTVRFRYKGTGPTNTIELKLLYQPDASGKGEVFGFSQREIVGTDYWVTFEQLYDAFGCGDTCTVTGQKLDPARVWKMDIAVSHQLGGTPGLGRVIVDQIEAFK